MARDTSIVRLQPRKFTVALPSADNKRLIGHAARKTVTKEELAARIIQDWLDAHDEELTEYYEKRADRLGMEPAELQKQVLGFYKRLAMGTEELPEVSEG